MIKDIIVLILLHTHQFCGCESIGISANDYESDVRFSNIYQDGMVLQREPYKATIWGYGIIPEGTKAITNCSLERKPLCTLESKLFQLDDNVWKMEVEAIKGGAVCNITVTLSDNDVKLKNVLFGDVWLCSGQSNMVFGMKSVYNATEE